MDDITRMRLYLRDATDPYRYTDEELQFLLDTSNTFEGSVAMGWLLTAADALEDPVSQSIGNTSESWGQATERYKIAMAMHNYWTRKDEEINGDDSMRVGLWWEIVPAETGGIVGRLFAHQDRMESLVATA